MKLPLTTSIQMHTQHGLFIIFKKAVICSLPIQICDLLSLPIYTREICWGIPKQRKTQIGYISEWRCYIINVFQTLNTLLQAPLLKLPDQRPLGNSDTHKQIWIHWEPDPPATTWTWKAEQSTTLKVNYRHGHNVQICPVCLGQACLFQLCQLIPPTYHFCCHCKLIHSSADFALYFKLAATIFWHFQNTFFCGSTATLSKSEV